MAASAGRWSGLIQAGVKLAGGIALMPGASGLARALRRLRGYPRVDDMPAERDTGLAQHD